MKKTLPLLIGLLLVGVVVYLYTKKKGNTVPPVTGGETESGKILDLYSTDSIIENLSLSKEHRKKAKEMANGIIKAANNGTGGWSRAALEKKASENDITYAQQIVISSLWQLYESAKVLSKDQMSIYVDEVRELN